MCDAPYAEPSMSLPDRCRAAARGEQWPTILPVALGFLVLATLFSIGLVQGGAHLGAPGLRPGRVAPDFSLTTFDGAIVRLSDYRGRPVVLNFWASWCPPCRAEAPALSKVATVKSDQVAFLGIDVRDREAKARAFVTEFAVPYPNGPDPGGVEAQYRGVGIPYTVFIAADGTVKRVWLGPLDEQRLIAFLEEL